MRGSTHLCCALLLALASCGGGGGEAPRSTAVVLRPLGEVPPEARSRVTSALEPPMDLAPWVLEGGEHAVEEGGAEAGAARRVLILGSGTKILRVPGPFDRADFDHVVLRVDTDEKLVLSAHLMHEGAALQNSQRVRVLPGARERRIELEFLRAGVFDQPFEELALRFEGSGRHVLHGPIELVDEAPAARLPDPDLGPRLIDVEGDERRGVGLAAGGALEGQLRIPRGAHLSLSFALWQDDDAPPATDYELRVKVEGPRGPSVARSFSLDAGAGARWQSAHVPLAALAGRSARLLVEFDSVGDPRAACAVADLRLCVPGRTAPTVLLVTSDTHRADHLGAAQRSVDVMTPNLDALAARGILFEDCFSATNVTNPSHIALLTGISPRDTTIVNNHTALGADVPLLAERFRDAGYVTFAALSSFSLKDSTSGLGRGFARMSVPREVRAAGVTAGELTSWLPDAEGLPLFVWLHLFDAHAPYEPPEPFRSQSYPEDRDPYDPALPEPDFPFEIAPAFVGIRDLEFPAAMYRAEVSYLDAVLGGLFRETRLGRGVVAVTADHGECLGQHGIYWSHEGLYPDTIHVPLVIAYPGAPAGARVREPVHHTDLARTLLDLAGLADQPFPGRNLVARLEPGAVATEPRFALSAHNLSASVTTGGHHMILHLRAHEHRFGSKVLEEHEVELYDLRSDPLCERNLTDEEPELARQIWRLLARWLVDRSPAAQAGAASEDLGVLEQLAGLGYTTDDASSDDALFDAGCACRWCQRFR